MSWKGWASLRGNCHELRFGKCPLTAMLRHSCAVSTAGLRFWKQKRAPGCARQDVVYGSPAAWYILCGRAAKSVAGWCVWILEKVRALPVEPRILALSPLLKEIIVRMMTWVANPEASAAKRRLVDVLHDEIRSASQIVAAPATPP